MWGYGTDRKKDYGSMIDKQSYRDQLGVDPSFKGYEIPRTGENISASKVRNALKIDDEKTFKQMTPKSIHSFYKTLQNTLSPIKENINMKNLKSLTSFSINEAKEYSFIFNYNTDKDDIEYIQKVLDRAGADAVAKAGVDSEEMVIRAFNAGGLRKARKAIEADGFQIQESAINEEYVESMDSVEIANALGKIEELWKDWRKGPMTEPSDIKPAQKELKGWIDRWFKQTIK
jgi:ribosomal protein L7/L12